MQILTEPTEVEAYRREESQRWPHTTHGEGVMGGVNTRERTTKKSSHPGELITLKRVYIRTATHIQERSYGRRTTLENPPDANGRR